MANEPPKKPEPFAVLRAAVDRLVKQGYADGMRRSLHIIAIAVGKLEKEHRVSLVAALDQLEDEAKAAEDAAQT